MQSLDQGLSSLPCQVDLADSVDDATVQQHIAPFFIRALASALQEGNLPISQSKAEVASSSSSITSQVAAECVHQLANSPRHGSAGYRPRIRGSQAQQSSLVKVSEDQRQADPLRSPETNGGAREGRRERSCPTSGPQPSQQSCTETGCSAHPFPSSVP